MEVSFRHPERTFTITVASGQNNPYGTRLELDVDGLLDWLRQTHPSETWFSGIRWRENWRKAAKFEGADLVALDYDWRSAHVKDAQGNCGVMPTEAHAKALETAQCALTPAAISYSTPRGMRFLVLCGESLANHAEYAAFAHAAEDRIEAALKADGGLGELERDTGNWQAGRIMFAPNIIDGPRQRTGRVVYSEDGLTSCPAEELMVIARREADLIVAQEAVRQQALEEKRAEQDAKHRKAVEEAKRGGWEVPLTFEQAKLEFCRRHSYLLEDWPKKSKREKCPVCAGSGFTTLDADAYRWVCHSTRHEGSGVGRKGQLGHWGSLLDLMAFYDNVTPYEELVRFGLLRGKNGRF